MFKNLKSLFVVSDDESTEEKSVTENKENTKSSENKTTATTTTTTTTTVQNTNTVKPVSGSVDNAILDKLLKAIDDNNQAGMDYLEFRQALKTLSNLPMDEATKFQSAYATASTMGITLQKLLESIDFYKKVLQIEDENFKKAMAQQSTANIDDKIKEKEAIELSIKQKSEQIQALTEQIRQNQTQIEELSSFIETTQQKITNTSKNFETTLQSILFEFNQDAEKLKQYIK